MATLLQSNYCLPVTSTAVVGNIGGTVLTGGGSGTIGGGASAAIHDTLKPRLLIIPSVANCRVRLLSF